MGDFEKARMGWESSMIARVNGGLRRSWRALAIVAIVVAGTAGVWLLGEHSSANLCRATLAIGGAGVVAWWATRRPVAAFGVLFVLSTLSRWTLELPAGNMRLEQPAIAVGLLALLYARRLPDRATLRRLMPIALAFMVYLGALTASSLLHSPDRADSLRMVFWTGLSMAGGLLVFLLLFGQAPEGGLRWLRLTGGGHAALGILIAVIFFTLGPVVVSGSDQVPGMAGKIFGVSWEANLFASLVAGLALFVIEGFRSRPRPASAALVVVVLVGLLTAETRGAYLGLAAGLLAYGCVMLYRRHQPRSLLMPGAVVVGAIVLGAGLMPILMQPRYQAPNHPIDLTVPGWGREFAIASYALPALPDVFGPWESVAKASPSPAPASVPAPGPALNPATPTMPPTPSPTAAPTPNDDTLAFRLDRVPVALKDLARDPIIGLGANSFGQRHTDPSQLNNQPDHIAILAVAALYESGVVGTGGLAIGFALILLALWRASRRFTIGPLAAAYIGSLVSLLISYEATNAINFSLIWLIAGAGLAMALRPSGREEAAPG
jgi:hypothetical protein